MVRGVTTYQFRMGPVASFRVLHMSLIESTLEVFVFICRLDRVIRKPSCRGRNKSEETLGMVTQSEADRQQRCKLHLLLIEGECTFERTVVPCLLIRSMLTLVLQGKGRPGYRDIRLVSGDY